MLAQVDRTVSLAHIPTFSDVAKGVVRKAVVRD